MAAVIVLVEYYVLLWPFHRDMITNAPGECYGHTTVYSDGWGSSRWDCMGNRLPNDGEDNVGTQIPYATPEEAIVGNTQRGPR